MACLVYRPGCWPAVGGEMDEGCAIIAQGDGRGGIYRVARDCVVTSAVGPQSAKAGKLRKKDEIVPICSAQLISHRLNDGWGASCVSCLAACLTAISDQRH